MPTRALALGPRISSIDSHTAKWIKDELARAALRFQRRYVDLVAMASLAPGIGSWWALEAHQAGIPLDIWVPHKAMTDHWPEPLRKEAVSLISKCTELAVPFNGPMMEPWMHGEHLKLAAAEADIFVAVWDGDREEFSVIPAYKHTNKPFHWINPRTRTVSWHATGFDFNRHLGDHRA